MEVAQRDSIYRRPAHPYTRALIESVPIPDPVAERERARKSLGGELPSPTNPPSGCVFRTRCPYAIDRCAASEPPLETLEDGRQVACIRHDDIADELKS
jgi:oligopeptide transport system ATP-binding protein